MPHLMAVEEIQKALQDRSPKKVAQATGLHFQTIRNVRDHGSPDTSYRVIKALSEYIQSMGG